jgi:hypothetical protein
VRGGFAEPARGQEHPADLAVQPAPPGRAHPLVDGLLDQRMRELVRELATAFLLGRQP